MQVIAKSILSEHSRKGVSGDSNNQFSIPEMRHLPPCEHYMLAIL